jgi:hypothetical protein
LLHLGAQCLIRYVDYPTYVSTKETDQSDAAFPAITVCPDGTQKYKYNVLNKYGWKSTSDYNTRDKIKVDQEESEKNN